MKFHYSLRGHHCQKVLISMFLNNYFCSQSVHMVVRLMAGTIILANTVKSGLKV